MPIYFFRISQGRYSGVSDLPSEFADHDAAWTEMKAVCSNLLGGIARNLKQDAQWHLELLDESRRPVFSIRLTAESVR